MAVNSGGEKVSRLTRNAKTLLPDKNSKEERQNRDSKELEEYLISLSPFNKRWQVERTLSSGSYGVVFLCRDFVMGDRGVVKVARHGVGHETAGWEAFIMQKITNNKANKNSNIVRLLDNGILMDNHNNKLHFMVLEFCEMPVKKYIGLKMSVSGRRARICQVLLGTLKGIYELHNQGLLHRDLKPDNMGILSASEPVTLLFDLGMTRMITNELGYLREPRTVVVFKGTIEWASGHAVKGREQSRWDDLIAWLYIAVELFDPDLESEAPYPWDNEKIRNTKAIRYLKSAHSVAKLLLKNCPPQFYAINTYLMCANRLSVPNYSFIAHKVGEAMQDGLGGQTGSKVKDSQTGGSKVKTTTTPTAIGIIQPFAELLVQPQQQQAEAISIEPVAVVGPASSFTVDIKRMAGGPSGEDSKASDTAIGSDTGAKPTSAVTKTATLPASLLSSKTSGAVATTKKSAATKKKAHSSTETKNGTASGDAGGTMDDGSGSSSGGGSSSSSGASGFSSKTDSDAG